MAKDIERLSIGRPLPDVSVRSQERVQKVHSSRAPRNFKVFLDAVWLARAKSRAAGKDADGHSVTQGARQRDPDAACRQSKVRPAYERT